MTQLIPVNQATAEELDAKLASTMFRSTEDFINFYNSGLINKTAEEVVGYAAEVDGAFKNVKLQGKNFVFISKAAVELAELRLELKKWDVLVRLKDRLSDLLEENVVDETTEVEFLSDAVGVLQKAYRTEEGTLAYEKLVDEKFFKPADEDLVAQIHSEVSSLSEELLKFRVKDFVELDDSFITEVYKIVLS